MQWLQADQKTSESRRGAGTSWIPSCKAPTAPKPQGATPWLGQMPPQHMAHCKHTLFSLSYTQYLSGSIKLVTKKLFYSLASTHAKRLNAVRCHSGVQDKAHSSPSSPVPCFQFQNHRIEFAQAIRLLKHSSKNSNMILYSSFLFERQKVPVVLYSPTKRDLNTGFVTG